MSDEIWARQEVDSPCIKICVIHPEERLCVGCLPLDRRNSQLVADEFAGAAGGRGRPAPPRAKAGETAGRTDGAAGPLSRRPDLDVFKYRFESIG